MLICFPSLRPLYEYIVPSMTSRCAHVLQGRLLPEGRQGDASGQVDAARGLPRRLLQLQDRRLVGRSLNTDRSCYSCTIIPTLVS